MLKKPNAPDTSGPALKTPGTLLPPRPAGLANGATVPRPIPNTIARNSNAPAAPKPVTALRPVALAPVSARAPMTLASPKRPAPVATPTPITIRPSSIPMSPNEKARVEALTTQVDASDFSPSTIPETRAASAIPTPPDSNVSVKVRSASGQTIPDADPSTPLVAPEPPRAATARMLSPSPFPVQPPVPLHAVLAPLRRTAPMAPQAPAPIVVAPVLFEPAPSAPAPFAPAPSAPGAVPVGAPSAPMSAPSPWRVVAPVRHGAHAVPWAPATPLPSPIITPAPSSVTSLASCDIKLDDSARQNSLLSFSDLAGMARDPMRSGSSSSGSIVLGDPVLRQKMMSIVAARRRRFTGVVFSAVAVCACVCAAAIVGSVASSSEPEAAIDTTLRGLRVAKEELLVPTHKHARARR